MAVFLVFSGCANTLPPSGGPPDETPPRVVKSNPENMTLNFAGEEISLEFNKHMDKAAVMENIFISPRAELGYDWSGKELEIELLEPLDANTTYSLTLGTDYTDYFDKNKPEQAFNLIFSTGSKIDSGSIQGMLFDDNPGGVYLFAYFLDGINADTLNPAHTKPDYLTQAGTNGKFSFNALKDGSYRIIAVRDMFKDGIYDAGIDGFGVPLDDVSVKQDSTPHIKLKVRNPFDKTNPALLEAYPLAGNVINAVFSENIDTFSVSKESFLLKDSAEGKAVDILSAYIDNKSASKVVIILSKALDTAKIWQLEASQENAVKDTAGNSVSDTARTAFFKADTGLKLIKPHLNRMPLKDSTIKFHPDAFFSFIFSTGIKNELNENISLVFFPDSQAVETEILWKADNYFVVKPLANLDGDTWHRLDFSTGGIKSYTGTPAKDTGYVMRFLTLDPRIFGSVSGVLIDSAGCSGNFIVHFINISSGKNYEAKLSERGEWKLKELPEGKYRIEAFCDENENGAYDYGSVFPFEGSEIFVAGAEEITVKSRWNVEDIKIVIRK